MSQTLKTVPVTIAAGAALSNAALLGDYVLVGIQMPAVWTAASLTFQVSYDNGATWWNLFDDGNNEIVLALGANTGQVNAVSPDPFGGVILLKVRSGTSATPVNQVAAAALTLIARRVFPMR